MPLHLAAKGVHSLPSQQTLEVLRALRTSNVLLVGPPSTGKTFILNEVRHLFEGGATNVPAHTPGSPVPFPKGGVELRSVMPAPDRTNRRAWYTVFHQDYSYRSFVVGQQITGELGAQKLETVRGLFLEAAEHARAPGCASLVIIDEVNRGNAARIFGDLIGLIDIDKRLGDEGAPTDTSISLNIPFLGDFSLPRHIYLLAAMNTADVSVAPLDLAFRRRLRDFQLYPDPSLLARRLNITDTDEPFTPDAPSSADEVKRLTLHLFENLNERIEIAAGRDYALGHGYFWSVSGSTPDETLQTLQECWPGVLAQLDDMFRSDEEVLGAVLQALPAPSSTDSFPFYFERKTIPGSSFDRNLLRRRRLSPTWNDFLRLASRPTTTVQAPVDGEA
jgi:5-methylcytosine-specific restriction protein B